MRAMTEAGAFRGRTWALVNIGGIKKTFVPLSRASAAGNDMKLPIRNDQMKAASDRSANPTTDTEAGNGGV